MKKMILFSISLLMVISLIITSCTSEETERTPETDDNDEVKITTTVSDDTTSPVKTPTTTGYRDPEEPKYGGTFNFITGDPMGFDPWYVFMVQCSTLYLCNEELLMGNWTQTPAGDGKLIGGFLGYASRLTGQLAESWSMPDNETLLFNIRQGVHWWDKAPLNGREYTAYDAEWVINHMWSPDTVAMAHKSKLDARETPPAATALDRYTLEVKVPPQSQGLQVVYTASWLYHYPREVVEEYGDMKDWKNVVGTGAYILADYISNSMITYRKNPNYWQYDPVHPENKLPYLDTLKGFVIPDRSTQLAAFRTGQIDYSLGIALNYDDGQLLLRQQPELEYVTIPGADNHLYFRIDKPELPWADLRVRRAMTMAINKEELIDSYYGGMGDLLGTPYPPDDGWAPFYTPLENMPDSVKELFYYSPDSLTKAKSLLSQAGYPNGFKTKIVCLPADVDFLSVIKEYFAQVNVTLEIQPLEASIFAGMRRGRTHEEGIYTASPTAAFPYDMHNTRIESFDCFSYYEHPVTRTAYNEQRKYVCKDDATYAGILKGVVPHILDECVAIWCPLPRSYRMWWPWVQNYHGQYGLGCDDQQLHLYYIWVDSEMKRDMGY